MSTAWIDREFAIIVASQPYPWAATPCPYCGETELAQHLSGALVCMNCGGLTPHPVGNPW